MNQAVVRKINSQLCKGILNEINYTVFFEVLFCYIIPHVCNSRRIWPFMFWNLEICLEKQKKGKKSDKFWPVWGAGQVVYICIPIWGLLGVKGVTPER